MKELTTRTIAYPSTDRWNRVTLMFVLGVVILMNIPLPNRPTSLLSSFWQQSLSNTNDEIKATDMIDPIRGFWVPYCPFFPNRPADLNQLVNETRSRLKSVIADELSKRPNVSIVVHTGSRFTIDEADMDLPGWRQTANSFYLLGHFNISNAIIILSQSCHGTTTHANDDDNIIDQDDSFCLQVFVPELTQRQAIFSGSLPDYKRLAKELRVQKVTSIRNLPSLIPYSHTLWFASSSTNINAALGVDVIRALRAKNIHMVDSLKAESWFHQARFLKTPLEMTYLRYAGRVSAWAHLQLQRLIEGLPSTETYLADKNLIPEGLLTESFLSAYFQHVCTLCGGTLQAYNPIVGAGPHGAVLHFPTGETPDLGLDGISSPNLILVDAGASYYHYTSDLTRTYFRNLETSLGTPHDPSRNAYVEADGHADISSRMSLLISLVKQIQSAGIDAFSVGNSWSDVVRVTQETMTSLLLQHDFLVGDYQELLDQGVHFLFMPHGLGHPVGLDVHDPVPAFWMNDTFNMERDRENKPSRSVTFKVPRIVQSAQDDIYYFLQKRYSYDGTHSRKDSLGNPHVPTLHHGYAFHQPHDEQEQVNMVPDNTDTTTILAMDFHIVPGVVQTIEPGIYFIPFLLDGIRRGGESDPDDLNRFLNWTTIDRGGYMKIGGVRIEDTFAIDEKGRRVCFTEI